jgi:hypothetical protein
MPRGLDDAVRAYQQPTPALSQLYLSQYNLPNNAPIYITPGFGGTNSGSLPQPVIQTGSAHYDETVTYYMDQAAVEATEQGF